MRDKTLLQALILGLGQVSAKILSLIFLFRFSNDLGKAGMSLYAYAYVPFSIFADLSCFGLIPGTSKLVSKLKADNKTDCIANLLWKGTIYASLAGACFFLFMLFFSRQILTVSLFDNLDEQTFNEVRMNLLFASISLFVIPLNHFFRGFLQGHLMMYPSCIAIILENVIKLVAYILCRNSGIEANYIHLTFIIYFASYLGSAFLLFLFVLKFYKRPKIHYHALFDLLRTSIPFGIATMFFTIYQFIDSISLPILLPVEGYYAAYMFETIRLIFFPIVIAQALGGALNPKMNYMFQEDKMKEANALAKKCSTWIIYILVPLTCIMKFFSDEIYHSFYQQEQGAVILYHISSLIFFFGLYKVLIGISIGLPRGYYIIVATIISAMAKYVLNYLFIPNFGYLGAIYSTMISVSICILAAYVVLKLEGILLFWKNIIAILKSFLAVFFSGFLVVVFRTCFSLKSYPNYYNIVLYSILLLGIYYILLNLNQPKKDICIE